MTTPEQQDSSGDMAAVLRDHVGPYYDEVFLATSHVFPSLHIIKDTRVEVRRDSDLIVGGLDSAGLPVVHLGTKGPLPQTVRDRLVRRMELPFQADSEYDGIFMRIIFAHEIGHVLQADTEFESLFGQIDRTTYIPEDDYSTYLNSDKEMNADYIAACLVGSIALGQAIGLSSPSFSSHQWRSWAETHH